MSTIKHFIKGTGAYKIGETVISSTPFVNDNTQTDNTSAWTKTDCTLTFNSDGYYETTYSDDTQYISKIITALTQNKRYRIRFDIKSDNATSNFRPFVYSNLTSSSGEGSLGALTSSWTSYDYSFNATGAWTTFGVYTGLSSGESYQIRNIRLEEIPPLPTITTGTKYLENTTAGTAAIQSKTAYGEWEFDVYKGADNNFHYTYFINSGVGTADDSYRITLKNSEALDLRKQGTSTLTLFLTSDNYISNNTWYRLKIARLQSEGVFKDVPTLQTSNMVNRSSLGYTTFTSNGRYGFSASATASGSYFAGTADELPVVNTAKYLVEFDLKLNSGTAPSIRIMEQLASMAISNTVVTTNGRNSIILTATSTTTGVLEFFNTTATDYEVSGLTIRRIYPADTFAVFIKGGSFGDNWTLVSTTGGSGTNPVTDSTYTTSNYLVADLDAGDRIANIKINNGIKL